MANASLTNFSGGPIVLILDFTTLDVPTLHSSFINVFEGDANGAKTTGNDLLAALTTFGFFHRVASSSGVCDDGCVPTAVIGLFSKGSVDEIETVWLYNSLDDETVVVREQGDGGESGRMERIQRQWTSNRHYDSGVLPVVVGSLRQYLITRRSKADNNEVMIGQKRSRSDDTAQGHDSALRTCQGAILKALCFINQHKQIAKISEKSGKDKKKRVAVPEQPFHQQGVVQLCLFSPEQYAHSSISAHDVSQTISMSELAQSMLAMQLESTHTRLYVGLGHGHRNHDRSVNTKSLLMSLAALAASSGGCCGWLNAPSVEESSSQYQGPTLADHMLGYVSDALAHSASTSDGPQIKGPIITSQWMKYAIHASFPSSTQKVSARRADPSGVSYIDTETLCVKEL